MSESVEYPDFLPDEARRELLEELETASSAAAAVLGTTAEGTVQPNTRRSKKVTVSDATRERLQQRLLDAMPRLSEEFGIQLTGCEAPQFLRYDEGDFFVPHQDGNSSLIRDESRFRRVSGVIFLSDRAEEPAPGTYGGGELLFHGRFYGSHPPVAASATPGTLVAFRAEVTHEVSMVTHGTRFTIAVFFR